MLLFQYHWSQYGHYIFHIIKHVDAKVRLRYGVEVGVYLDMSTA